MKKLVRENINFERGKKSIYDTLKVGMYHAPWTIGEIYDLHDGSYIAISDVEVAGDDSRSYCIFKKDGTEISMRTYWTSSGPELWPEQEVLTKKNLIDIPFEEWFNVNITKIIPLVRPLLILQQLIKKPMKRISWEEIIEKNESEKSI